MKALAEKIRSANSILLSTHEDPDGDGLGAVLAMALALGRAGKVVHVALPDPAPERFHFLDPEGLLRSIPKDALDLGCPRPDLALVIDTHQWSLLGRVGELIRREGIETVFLDHHPLNGEIRGDVHGDPNSCSTGELVHRLLLHYLDLPIDARIGECLYTSIAYDTHSFRYLRNNPSPHLVAADLLSRGVDATKIYRHLFASNPVGKMRLLGQILRSIRLEEEGRLAYVALPLSWIREHNVCRDDLRDTVNTMLEFEGVEVAVMMKEVMEGMIKVSLRSKGRLEVNGAAMSLGGGGHMYAAGATLTGDLDAAELAVLAVVRPILTNSRPEKHPSLQSL